METFAIGRENKGDLRIVVNESGKKSNTINLQSSVGKLYGDNIVAQMQNILKAFDVTGLDLDVIDDGALPYVINARTIAVARMLGRSPKVHALSKKPVDLKKIRRSRLYLPGNNPYLAQNAWLFGADILLLDLEDSVPPAEKYGTRILVKHTVLNMDFGSSEVAVRINPLWTPFGEEDLREIIPACPDIIFIPKAESGEDILRIDEIVTGIHYEKGIDHVVRYFPIIESARGVVNAFDIAKSNPNIIGLAFGAEDYTRDMGIQRTVSGKETIYARSAVVNAAKAAGIQASDTVFSDLDDMAGFIESAIEAKSLGFDGKGLIHPKQINVLHDIFNPSESEIDYAKQVIEAAELAEKEGAGVVALGKKMIDPPVVARAHQTLEVAKKLGII